MDQLILVEVQICEDRFDAVPQEPVIFIMRFFPKESTNFPTEELRKKAIKQKVLNQLKDNYGIEENIQAILIQYIPDKPPYDSFIYPDDGEDVMEA